MDIKTLKDPDTNLFFAHLQSTNIEECLKEIQAQNIENIILNSAFGWEEGSDISFLKSHKWIKGIRIVNEFCNISPINFLQDLKYFGGVGKFEGVLDFSNLPKLEFLAIDWDYRKYHNLDKLISLKEARISKFPDKDLSLISHFIKLEKLKFYFTKFENLSGIEDFSKLVRLDIYSAPKLQNIDDLTEVSENVKDLFFELCPKINSFKVLDKMPNLESLYIFRSSPIHSVQFLEKLKKLRYAYIGTEILDGKVEYLNERQIAYKKLKKYNIS